MKPKFNIKRRPSSEYFSSDTMVGITREQASTISKYLNSYKDTTLTPDHVLSNVKNYIHVTHNDDKSMIVGAAQLKRKDWKRCSVESIVIDEKYRKQGYGKKLLEQVEEKAGYRDFKTLDAVIDDTNESSKFLLEKYGFKKNLVFYDATTKKNMSTWEKEVKPPERKKKVPVMVF